MSIIFSESRNISQWIHEGTEALTLSLRRFLSYRNQSSKMHWFLYNRGFRHERFKSLFIHHTPRVCSYMLLSIIRFFFVILFCFFPFSFPFTDIHDSESNRWKGRLSPYILFYHFYPLHRHLDISWVIAVESSPLRIGGSWNRTGNLWSTIFRIHSFYTCTCSCCC